MPLKTFTAVCMAGLVAGVGQAQDLAPRAYLITPTGSNAVILSYSFFDGSVFTDPTLPIQDFKARYHAGVFSYYRAFNFLGRSANVTGSLPYALGNFQATIAGAENRVYRSNEGTFTNAPAGVLAYHPPCTLQHGQKLRGGVEVNLRALGFDIQVAGSESHLCCGSAGTYNILQPAIAADLRDRKVANIRSMRPDLVATGNIGCITQLASGMDIPIAHTVELLDWAYGGPMPRGLEALAKHVQDVPEAKPLFAVT
jgi:hypothetical protein